ncbi:retrovirus-related pol polyprotein from transposon TNT 1-94 [Tanacetum coccineum]
MVLNSPCFTVKSWLVQDQTVPVQKQTAFGKDKSNPLIVDSLLKTIRLSIHLVVYNEELAIPEQTATGKGISNPLMAAPRTSKSNGVVERKTRTLQEMTRTMLYEQKFWCNTVDTATYILNRILIRPFLRKTPYELFKGKKHSLEYFKVFGSKCFILNTKDYLTKFDPKSTEGIFLSYSPNSKAYVVPNRETMRVEESLNVKFNESPPPKSPPLEDDVLENENIERQEKDLEIKENEPLNKEIPNIKESKDHPLETVIDENGIVSRNKARLVAQGYNQQEGIGFDETYAPVARL